MDRQNSTLARGENRKCVREGEKVGTRGGGGFDKGDKYKEIRNEQCNNYIERENGDYFGLEGFH